MCKILVLTNTSKIEDLEETVNVMAKALLDSEEDGFGYAVLGTKGFFGERTNRPRFKSRMNMGELTVKIPIYEKTMNSFGKFTKPVGAGMFHGRTSTNDKTLINTHPIQKNGWTLIHNGVVNNHGPKYQMETTNDTEHLVHYLSTEGIKAIEQNITGYYAFSAIDPFGNLHVVKDSVANLFVAYVEDLDCHLFGTSEDLIETVTEQLEWTIGPIEVVCDDIYMVFDKKGKLIKQESITPKGYTQAESMHALSSLGRHVGSAVMEMGPLEAARYDESKILSYAEESYYNFLAECEDIDASYTIKDYNGRTLELWEFKKLDDVTKAECTITRGDGTVLDPDDYHNERIA
jgi:hypothetical protein